MLTPAELFTLLRRRSKISPSRIELPRDASAQPQTAPLSTVQQADQFAATHTAQAHVPPSVPTPFAPQAKAHFQAKAHSFTGASRPLTAVQLQVLERIETCYQQAEAQLKRHFPRPVTEFSLRGKSAGTAHLQQNRLRFNPVLLRENSAAFLREVVPHEICHLLCFQLFGKTKPHGKEWQSLMLTLFKVQPSTTHSFNTASVAGPEVEYHCACGPIKLSIRRHNKVLRAESRYLCKRCKTQLVQSRT